MEVETKARIPVRSYFVVAMLTGAYSLNFLDRQLLSILAEPVKKDLLLSDTQLGLLSGLAFAIFYTVFGIPIAWLADRSNRVRIVAVCCALWSLFTSACGLAQNFGQLALARVGVAVGEAGGSPPAYSIIADYFPATHRARALAIYSLGVPIGTTAGAALGGWIAAEHGWRMAFLTLGLFGIAWAVVIGIAVKEPARGQLDNAPVGTIPLKQTLAAFASNPILRTTAIAAALSAFIGYAMLSWTPAMLMRTKGMSLSELATYYSLTSGIAATIGTLLSGTLVDVLGSRDKRMYGLVPAAAFGISIPFYVAGVYVQDWQVSLFLLSVPFAFYASYLPAALTIVQNTLSPAQRSTASAFLLFLMGLFGLGGGPLFIGRISDSMTGHHPAPLQFAMLALAPIFLVTTFAHLAVARQVASKA